MQMSSSKVGIKSQLTKQLFLLLPTPSDTESTLITQNHTESQNGKLGRDHWRSSHPTFLLKQDALEYVA